MTNIRTFEAHTPNIAASAYIDPLALVVGDVTIGDHSSVWPMTVIRGDVHKITIGQRTNIQDGSILHVTHRSNFVPDGFPLIVGDDVTVGHRVILHACEIRSRALIGMGAIVLDGAIVEEQVIIGAGALVPPGKILKSGHLYLGNPVRLVRQLTQEDIDYFAYAANHYVKLKDKHLHSV